MRIRRIIRIKRIVGIIRRMGKRFSRPLIRKIPRIPRI